MLSQASNLSELLFCTWMLYLPSMNIIRSLNITSMVWLDSRNTDAEFVRQYWVAVVVLVLTWLWEGVGCLYFFIDFEQAYKINSFFLISLSYEIFSQTYLLVTFFSVVQVTVFFMLFSKYIQDPSLNTKQMSPVFIWYPYPKLSLMSTNSVMQLFVQVMLRSDGLIYFEDLNDLKFLIGMLDNFWQLGFQFYSVAVIGIILAVWMFRILLFTVTFYWSFSWNFEQYSLMYWLEGGHENMVLGRMCGKDGYFLNML